MNKSSKEIFVTKGDDILNFDSIYEINDSFLEHKFKEGHESLIIPQELICDKTLEVLNNISKNDYFIQLGYWAMPENVKVLSSNEFSVKLTSETPRSNEHLISNVKRTTDKYFTKQWSDYIKGKFEDSFDYYHKNLKKDDALYINHENKMIGMICILDSLTDYLNRKVDQVAWVWVDSSIDKDIRIATHSIISKWLSENCNSLIQTGIHLYNVRSQNFFLKLGFELTCVYILKR